MGAVDPRQVLGVAADASPEEVARAYREQAKRWHPDHAGQTASAQARMAQINAAYDALRDGPAPPAAIGTAEHPFAPPPPSPPRRRPGDWLADDVRRALGRELLAALRADEQVALVTTAATWKSPGAVLAVTEDRLLWLLDDAITNRVHSLRWRDVLGVSHHPRRPLRRTALLRVETHRGRRLEWAELPPATAQEIARAVAARAGLGPAAADRVST